MGTGNSKVWKKYQVLMMGEIQHLYETGKSWHSASLEKDLNIYYLGADYNYRQLVSNLPIKSLPKC